MKDAFKSVKRILHQLGYILTLKQKKAAIIIFVCMLINSGLELLGVSIIYPFLQMLLSPEQVRTKWYIAWLYKMFPTVSEQGVFLALSVFIMLVYLAKNGFMLLSAHRQYSYANQCQREISVNVLRSAMNRPYQFFLNINSSELYRVISSDVAGVYQTLINFFSLIMESITIICLGAFLFITDYIMTLGAMTLAAICFILIIVGFKEKMKIAGKEAQEAAGLSSKYAYQAINGIKEITVLGRKENFIQQYAEAALLTQKTITTSEFISSCPDRILEGVCISGFIGVACIRICCGADINNFVPVLGTFAMAAFKILPCISKISSRINMLVFYQGRVQSVYDNFREVQTYENEMKEYVKLHAQKDKTKTNLDGIRFENRLEIKGVSWRYQNAQDKVLNDVSIKINKGESIALVGTSGAGKSTLADIIMGLFRPQEGAVEMDGIDIFTIPNQWTKIIGYVPQSVFLVDDTIRNNIAFGLKKEQISDDEVWLALQQAQLKKFVEQLPYGLDTLVGERGVRFSGGQRQRIAIARALYNQPEILVLDEATAALDNETETAVMESIEALQGQVTLIIVAHRLTTIRNCDVIFEIKDGHAIRRDKKEVLNK